MTLLIISRDLSALKVNFFKIKPDKFLMIGPRKINRKTMFHALEPFQARRKADKLIGIFLATLILLNVLVVVLETVQSIKAQFESFFFVFEIFSVAVFSIEYILRLWVSAEGSKGGKVFSRLKYIFTPMAIIDLLAIMPFYLPLMISVDLRYLRALRLFRILRVLKLGRYSKSLNTLGLVLKNKTPDLIVATATGLILLTVSASIMFFFENSAQPETFSSIPASMWWAVSTLTTIGYGDVYPITLGGKIFGSLVAVLGVGLIAIPTGILGAGLIESIEVTKHENDKCPHCGSHTNSKEDAAA